MSRRQVTRNKRPQWVLGTFKVMTATKAAQNPEVAPRPNAQRGQRCSATQPMIGVAQSGVALFDRQLDAYVDNPRTLYVVDDVDDVSVEDFDPDH